MVRVFDVWSLNLVTEKYIVELDSPERIPNWLYIK